MILSCHPDRVSWPGNKWEKITLNLFLDAFALFVLNL
jgi:hypothetical protein